MIFTTSRPRVLIRDVRAHSTLPFTRKPKSAPLIAGCLPSPEYPSTKALLRNTQTPFKVVQSPYQGTCKKLPETHLLFVASTGQGRRKNRLGQSMSRRNARVLCIDFPLRKTLSSTTIGARCVHYPTESGLHGCLRSNVDGRCDSSPISSSEVFAPAALNMFII